MRKYLIMWTMVIPLFLLGQNDQVKLYEPHLIKADIDTLINQLLEIHPSFHDRYTHNNWSSKIENIKSSINTPISSLEFFRLMQPFVAIDGHTTLRYTDGICPGVENPLFPFKVILRNGSLYVKENLTDNLALEKGTIIQKINGIDVAIIVDKLMGYIPGEKQNFKTKKLESQFHIFLALVYGSFSEFNITVKNATISLKGAAWDDFQSPAKPKFELRFYDDDIAYIYKRMFMPPRDFLSFMDSAFTAISEKKINYLIIDNLQGGGLSDLSDSLMSYFTNKPYAMMERQSTKINYLTEDFIESNKSRGTIRDGYFIQDYPLHASVREHQFSGSTYILAGPLSYSAATCFSAAAKCYQTAFIVGEESGQPLLSNGGLSSFTLPNTNMDCITSLSVIYMPCNNNDQERSVLPDYTVKPTLEDQLNDKDYLLDYTLQLIRKDRLKK